MHIFVVEDDAAVAASLDALLSGSGFRCSMFANGRDFLSWEGETPDCVLLDVKLPGMDGIEVLQEYRRRYSKTPVVIMTGHGDVSMAVEALHLGANDFIEKPFQAADLISRIQDTVKKAWNDIECQKKLAALTMREADVLRGVVAGHRNKIIAHNLGISQKTVELHRARVMDKTGSDSVSQLVRTALRGGLEMDGSA